MPSIKTVVQTTSKTTPVTANYKNCIIRTVPLTDAADTFFDFVVNNKQLYPEQNIQLTPIYNGATGVPVCTLVSQTQFRFTIRVHNGGTGAFTAPVSINVSVIN